jgi:hypothetical protein
MVGRRVRRGFTPFDEGDGIALHSRGMAAAHAHVRQPTLSRRVAADLTLAVVSLPVHSASVTQSIPAGSDIHMELYLRPGLGALASVPTIGQMSTCGVSGRSRRSVHREHFPSGLDTLPPTGRRDR